MNKTEELQGELPKWIDDQKGKDPLMDDMIHYIEQLRAAIAASQQAAEPVAWQYRVRLGSGDWSEWRVCTYKTLVEGMRNNPLYELYDLVRAAPAIQQPQDDHAEPDNPLFLALAKKGG